MKWDRATRVWGIHQKFKIDEDTIRSSNMDDSMSMTRGKILRIPNKRGTLYQVKTGRNPRRYPQEIHLGPPGSRFLYEHRSGDEQLSAARPRQRAPAAAGRTATSSCPIRRSNTGPWISRYQGRLADQLGFWHPPPPRLQVRRRHHGWDIPKPHGSPVNAAQAGRVTFSGWSEGYGNLVVLTHSIKGKNGYNVLTTRYGHLSQITGGSRPACASRAVDRQGRLHRHFDRTPFAFRDPRFVRPSPQPEKLHPLT